MPTSKSRCSSRDSSNASGRLLTPLSEYNDELPVKEYISVTNKTRDVLLEKGMILNGGNRKLISKRKLKDALQ